MAKLKMLLLTGSVLVSGGVAFAADVPPPEAPPAPFVPGGWYLRGDIGFSNQRVNKLRNPDYAGLRSLDQKKDFDTAGFAGVGVGYRFNEYFRVDVTGEYRGKSDFHGRDTIRFVGTDGSTVYSGTDSYTANKRELVGLVNGYVDLGTWYNFTPFVGAGVGVSRNTISGFTDIGVNDEFNETSIAYAGRRNKTNFAWALMAGVGYEVTPGLTLEVAYRYLDLGKGRTGDLVRYDGVNERYNPFEFKRITSHDVKLGLRWALGGAEAPPPPIQEPLMRSY